MVWRSSFALQCFSCIIVPVTSEILNTSCGCCKFSLGLGFCSFLWCLLSERAGLLEWLQMHRYDSFLSCQYQHRSHGRYNRYLPVLTSEISHIHLANLQSEVFPASLQLWWKQKAGSDFCKLPLRITEEVEEEATASLVAAGVDVAIATVLTILDDIFFLGTKNDTSVFFCFFFKSLVKHCSALLLLTRQWCTSNVATNRKPVAVANWLNRR